MKKTGLFKSAILAVAVLCLAVLPVYAQSVGLGVSLNSPAKNSLGVVAADRCAPLGNTVTSTVWDIDATCSPSYSGTGTTWANIEATPADSATATDYDWFTGDGSTSSRYPTFTGSAGTASAYFAYDGGDDNAIKTGANTTFFNNIHKTTGGSDYWVACAGRWQTGALSIIFDTKSSGSTVGLSLGINADATLLTSQRGGSASSSVSSTGLSVVDDADQLLVFTHQHSGNLTNFWVNGTALGATAHTFNTTTNNASGLAKLSAFTNSLTNKFASGTRLYGCSMGNAYITNTQEAVIRGLYETRHARDYTN